MLEIDSNPEPLTAAELESVPVFPLPRLVFFPGTVLPLHLFEPRYLAMVEDCLSKGPDVIAVTMLEAGHDAEVDDLPPIKTVAGVGRIVGHERLSDGRHNIVLQGMVRARLKEHVPSDRPYRRAHAAPLTDEGGANSGEIAALVSCAQRVVQTIRKEHPEYSLNLAADQPPCLLTDVIADGLLADHVLRQQVLETLDIGQRVRMVTDAVGELMATLAAPSSKQDLH